MIWSATCLQLANLGPDPAARRIAAASLVEQSAGAALVILPELWTVGYFAFDDYERSAEPLDGPTLELIAEAARRIQAHVVLGSFIERTPDGLHNTTAVLAPDGGLLATYRKVHVFGYGSRETELVMPGDGPVTVATELGVLGLATCYDLRFPELFRLMVDEGAEVFVIPAAWPDARREHWRLLARARAVENQAYVLTCNGAGGEGSATLAGHSAIIDPWGEVIAEAGESATTLTGLVDVSRVTDARATFPALADRRLPSVAGAAR